MLIINLTNKQPETDFINYEKKIENYPAINLFHVYLNTSKKVFAVVSIVEYIIFSADGSDTDYQLSGLTPVIPDELFR